MLLFTHRLPHLFRLIVIFIIAKLVIALWNIYTKKYSILRHFIVIYAEV